MTAMLSAIVRENVDDDTTSDTQAYITPAIDVTTELPTKASSFQRRTSTPMEAAATSPSLIAFQYRPGARRRIE